MEILRGQAGDSIDNFLPGVIELIKQDGILRQIQWNNVLFTVYKDDTVETALAEWQRLTDEAAKAYHNGPAGIKARLENEARQNKHQILYDELMTVLPSVLTDESALLTWLAEYSDVDEYSIIRGRDYKKIISLLESIGYKSSDSVGLEKSQYNNPDIMAKYIVGQCIYYMEMGMPPHQMTAKFVADYHKVKR